MKGQMTFQNPDFEVTGPCQRLFQASPGDGSGMIEVGQPKPAAGGIVAGKAAPALEEAVQVQDLDVPGSQGFFQFSDKGGLSRGAASGKPDKQGSVSFHEFSIKPWREPLGRLS